MSLTDRAEILDAGETAKQREYTQKVASVLGARYPGGAPRAFVHTYGCQGNVADSERITGMLIECGYEPTSSPEDAELCLYNTCAIREHAEDRVFGNVGELKRLKAAKPDMLIVLCGCMTQQEHIAHKIKHSYPYVDILFGTHALYRLPELLSRALCTGRRVFEFEQSDGIIAEGLPVFREKGDKAWLPIMYGCDNFCSYCVVPYVRGRERSRTPDAVIAEAREILAQGCTSITLLGQNVNSYGRGCSFNTDFSELIDMLDALDGDFSFDFMTSHPKDCTHKLIDALAASKHYCRHLHLPVQCGSSALRRQARR